MSNAWQQLDKECSAAIEKCAWCAGRGHKMPDCPSYLNWHLSRLQPSEQEDQVSWLSFVGAILLCAAVVGGLLWARHWGW